MNKIIEYKKLVAERKACNRCASLGMTNPSQVRDENGKSLDSNQMGPWSRWQGNLYAPLMVVGRDWGGVKYFCDNEGWDKHGNPTNLALIDLIGTIGFSIQDVDIKNGPNNLFFTNAVLCLKHGNLQDKVNIDKEKEKKCFQNCALFLRRQIEIVNPVAVVGLGELAYRAILSCFNLELKTGQFRAEVEAENGRELFDGTYVFAVYDCAKKSINMRNRTRGTLEDEMKARAKDWMRIQNILEKQKINSQGNRNL